ncbi:RDD family protein [Hymenobacter cellulosilyticus]|uniref:RDD family protein n=1 Tax=Hymenobacter cellulosilyticus TaxID=2932248 RepID=A0A8T9Q3H1_9BACT|nr:RDD family protein [Hymenobacter cellulosilyticus]UOQ72017.1 RDD family protein [Hymenobacter cellulosilyticus]
MQQYYADQDYPDERVENPSVFADLLNSPLALTEATSGQRFANNLIDLVTFYLSFSIVSFFLLSFRLAGFIFKMGNAGFCAFTLLLLAVYYFSLELTTGRTMGKLITRTRVVMEDGSKPKPNDILKRTLCRMIPLEAFTFLGTSPGLHDRLSKTRVVQLD